MKIHNHSECFSREESKKWQWGWLLGENVGSRRGSLLLSFLPSSLLPPSLSSFFPSFFLSFFLSHLGNLKHVCLLIELCIWEENFDDVGTDGYNCQSPWVGERVGLRAQSRWEGVSLSLEQGKYIPWSRRESTHVIWGRRGDVGSFCDYFYFLTETHQLIWMGGEKLRGWRMCEEQGEVYSFPGAAITKCHKLGGWKQQ